MGTTDAALRERYRNILSANCTSDYDSLRRLVLLDGLPTDANALPTDLFGRCSLRGLVWKALLGVGIVDADEYASLVRQGPSVVDSRVREDARRTFSQNDDFTTRVPNEKMIRLLNAYVTSAGNKRAVYAQSMGLLAAPFLYVMPEPDAFHCFRIFLRDKIPSYVKRYIGARQGCALLDKCLLATDPRLHKLFADHGLNAEVFAFSSISSLGACVQPMSETVRLWDILLAFGVHMHILFCLSRLLLSSQTILETASQTSAAPLITRQLEQGLGQSPEAVLGKAVPLSSQLDDGLYTQLVSHSTVLPTTSPRESVEIPNVQGSLGREEIEPLGLIKDVQPGFPLPSEPSGLSSDAFELNDEAQSVQSNHST